MYQLTGSQQNIILSEQRFRGLPINTIHTTINFWEGADVYLLKNSVDFVIKNADVFRLKLIDQDGQITQSFDSCSDSTCTIDTQKYTATQLDDILASRNIHVFTMDEKLYDFTIYQKTDDTCIVSMMIHHILIDGFGLGILSDEITRVYFQMLCSETLIVKTCPFANSITQFPETIAKKYKEDADFWNVYFDGYIPGTQPFASKSHCALSSSFHGKIHNTDILRFCDENAITPYTVFVAALSLYIMKICQSEEAIVIVPRMNREQDERTTIGDFSLPVPMRVKKGNDFKHMCRQIREEGKKVSAHKKYSFSKIVEDFKKRFQTDETISDYTVNFLSTGKDNIFHTETAINACGAMNNLVTLYVNNNTDDNFYDITYDYRKDILSETYMEFFHHSLLQIIQQAISGNEIHVMTDNEITFLKNEFKGTTVKYSADKTIVSLFQQAVCHAPNSTAVIAKDKTFTYTELDCISNRIAHALLEKGVTSGSLIAFLLERDSLLIPTIFGILKTGCAFLPLDINYPKDRIHYILTDSKAKIIISTSKLGEKFNIDYTDIDALIAHENASSCSMPIAQNDLAYCIYTSGTSGKPKGVLLEHKGIVNITREDNNPFNKDVIENGKGIVAIGSICFDISLFEIFVFLLNGKFVALSPDDELADGEQIATLFSKTKANALHCTPSRLHSYLLGNLFFDVLKSQIDIILSAGEVLPRSLTDLVSNEFEARIYNGFGPTETTIGVTITEAGDMETVGRPIANTALHIVDKNKELLPFGVTGEIAIAGDGVGRGYLNNPTLTEEKFVEIDGHRAYLTGDSGYFTPDKRLMYVGRLDHQIKLRGFRIELSEIEQCVLDYDGIDSCAVVVGDINDDKHLIMYYTSHRDIDEEGLKERLREFLSYYMIPEVMIPLETMPANANGKINRDALQKLPVTIDKEYVPPRTKEESILCDAFKTTLSMERVGIHDNFFEIGGTSILATKVMRHAKKCNLNLEYSSIFRYPTPKLLAENIQKSTFVNYLSTLPKDELHEVNELLACEPSGKDAISGLGNVFLTGATGYLGSHILKLLIADDTVKKIYCIVRTSKKLSGEKRLRGTLFYYFSDMFMESFEDRITVINGDITGSLLFDSIDANIDTVINCAANVAHFAYGDTLKSVNVDALENIIDFCRKKDAALVHISTISVAGHNFFDDLPQNRFFTEQNLYENQIISNEYIYSKFAAEYATLKAKKLGLKAKIMRVGNLQGRMADGEFQINLQGNAFARQLKSYAAIGKAPLQLMEEAVNFTPVDETAKAVLLLAKLDDSYHVFHVINPVCVPYKDIFACLSCIEKNVEYMETDAFEALVDKLYRSDESNKLAEGLLIEKSDIHLHEMPVQSDFTIHVLARFGFHFSTITTAYLENYLKALNGLGFFDEEEII